MLLRTGTIAALYSHDWSCLSNVSMCETNAAANAAGIIEWWSNWVTQILWISLEQGRFLIPFLNIISSLFLYPFLCGRRDEVWKKRLKWIIQTSPVHRTMIYWQNWKGEDHRPGVNSLLIRRISMLYVLCLVQIKAWWYYLSCAHNVINWVSQT